MRRTKEAAEETRQTLLDAALTVFSQKGYSAATLEDVAAAAGLTRGAIYHHFGGKVEMFSELLERASQVGNQAVGRAIAEGGSFTDIAQRVLSYTLQLLATDPQYRLTMSLLLFYSSGSPELAPLRQAQEQQGLKQLEQIVGFFRIGLAQGDVRPDLDPAVAARAFLAYQNGLVLLWLSSPGIIDIDKHAPGLSEIFVRGIHRA